jgi:hypothetical protein
MTNTNPRGMLVWTALFAVGLLSCAPHQLSYFGKNAESLGDQSLSALCLPATGMRVEYIDNTQLHPDIQFADSFLLNAANGLIMYEISKQFKMSPSHGDSSDSLEKFQSERYSVIAADTALILLVSKRMQNFAAKHGVDIIVAPYAVYIKQQAIRPDAWRGDNGPGYDRPISYTAKTSVHIQIWDKNGQLLFERIGKSSTGKPVLYSLLKREKPNQDIVKIAKRMYGPPLIKSLYASIISALPTNRERAITNRARQPRRFGR